jgi:hypothetical protein
MIAVIADFFCGEKPQSFSRNVGYMSCVPCDEKFIIVISPKRKRNSFQCETIPRPRSVQEACFVFRQTSDSFTPNRTNSASSAGSPPIQNSGRQPHRGKTK